jgi:hypothetical protein
MLTPHSPQAKPPDGPFNAPPSSKRSGVHLPAAAASRRTQRYPHTRRRQKPATKRSSKRSGVHFTPGVTGTQGCAPRMRSELLASKHTTTAAIRSNTAKTTNSGL